MYKLRKRVLGKTEESLGWASQVRFGYSYLQFKVIEFLSFATKLKYFPSALVPKVGGVGGCAQLNFSKIKTK